MTSILFVFMVAALGGLGSMLRFVLSRFSGRLPWGILIANTLASLLAGVFLGGAQPAVPYALLVLGFAGGLSTFSSWAAQTASYWRTGQYRRATYNAALNLLLPAAAVVAGAIIAFSLLK
jgi:fluoride exporter